MPSQILSTFLFAGSVVPFRRLLFQRQGMTVSSWVDFFILQFKTKKNSPPNSAFRKTRTLNQAASISHLRHFFFWDLLLNLLKSISLSGDQILFSTTLNLHPRDSAGLDFLFNQPEQSEDFQFPFTSESPADNKENTTTDFPFSFNF